MTLEEFYCICDGIEPDERGCHIWPRNYAHVRIADFRRTGRSPPRRINRLALERKLGRPIRPGLFSLHSCDNAICVNPDHLREGTQKENQQDRAQRNQESYANFRTPEHREQARRLRKSQEARARLKVWNEKLENREYLRKLGQRPENIARLRARLKGETKNVRLKSKNVDDGVENKDG